MHWTAALIILVQAARTASAEGRVIFFIEPRKGSHFLFIAHSLIPVAVFKISRSSGRNYFPFNQRCNGLNGTWRAVTTIHKWSGSAENRRTSIDFRNIPPVRAFQLRRKRTSTFVTSDTQKKLAHLNVKAATRYNIQSITRRRARNCALKNLKKKVRNRLDAKNKARRQRARLRPSVHSARRFLRVPRKWPS